MPADDAPLLRHAAALVHGRQLVRVPRAGRARLHWFGFHGYAQTAEAMLPAFERSAGEAALVVSVQALHPFYAGRTNEVVANWMTRQDRERAIASNVAYVDAVVEAIDAEFGAPDVRVFAGFSQGVGMAWRAAALGGHACAAVVAVGGDVPPELLAAPPRAWPPALLATGERDAWCTPDALAREAARLRERGADVRTLVFDGGHEWSAAVEEAARAWCASLAGGATR